MCVRVVGRLTGHLPLHAVLGALCGNAGWARLSGHPSHSGRPAPCGGRVSVPGQSQHPRAEEAPHICPPSYPREAEANRRGAGGWWWRVRHYSGRREGRTTQAGLARLGVTPAALGRVGSDSSSSKPVAGRPRLRQTSNICLEPSLLPALTTICKNYFYQRNTRIW